MNKKLLLLILIGTASAWLSACSSIPQKTVAETGQQPRLQESSSAKGKNIALLARSMLGKAYRYGGSSPQQGFDCSGLVYFTHTQMGDYVPRTSYQQLEASKAISLDELKPGDLLFYRINGKPSHVGIYIGDKQFVHAPSSGKKVSVASMDNPYFKPRLIRAGRLYQE